MTLGCEAAALTTRPLRQPHSHTIKLFYLCQSVSICYYVLPSFRFWRNYIILYININITYFCLYVVIVLLVQWLALWFHTQESEVQISLIQNSISICIFFYTIFFYIHTVIFFSMHYCQLLYYYILLYNTISYYTLLYCTRI